MFTPRYLINLLRIEIRRRKSKKRGGKFKLKIGNVPGFIRKLEEAEIEYVVLRWFEDVPLTPEQERKTTKDIDLLFQHSDLKKVIRIGARYQGNVLAEFYSVSGKKGTSARGYPYYPPILAQQIISHRERYQSHFYVPSPHDHFQSLCYHLVFHKGYESGLPVNSSTPPKDTGKRDYPTLIQQFAEKQGIALQQPITLESLYRYLVSTDWTMPYDLKLRWDFCQQEWIDHLCRIEESEDFTYAEKLPGLIVFLIREDGSDLPGILKATIDKIEKKFTITETIDLDEAQQKRVIHNVRGGNWLEYGKKVLVPPTVALICFDPAPDPITKDHPAFKKYPLMNNANLLLKNKIREEINEQFPSEDTQRTVVHSSDNTMEAHHHLLYVVGKESYPKFCDNLLGKQ